MICQAKRRRHADAHERLAEKVRFDPFNLAPSQPFLLKAHRGNYLVFIESIHPQVWPPVLLASSDEELDAAGDVVPKPVKKPVEEKVRVPEE